MAYYRRRAREHSELAARQKVRELRVEEIDATSVNADDMTILGEPWFDAWLTVATCLAVEGRFHEILPPKVWLAGKMLGG